MGKNEAQIKYRKKAVKTLYLDLNIKTDADIIQWLDKTANRGGSKSGEIKRACRNLIPQDAYQFLGAWHCPSCPAKYTPVEGQLISYCPHCGQAIINVTGKGYTPVDSGAKYTPVDDSTDNPATLEALSNAPEPSTGTEASADKYTPVDSGAKYTPVDDNADNPATLETLPNTPEPSTGTETSAETSTPVDTDADACTPVDAPNYEVYYITKKGGEHYRNLKVHAQNAKEAIAIFRAIHKSTFEKTEGHAFQPKAKRVT